MYIIVLCLYVPKISELSSKIDGRYEALIKQNQTHKSSFATSFNINSVSRFVSADVKIGLNLTYPNAILAANIPVNITGIVYIKNVQLINSSSPKSIDRIYYGFQNCIQFPLTLDEDDVPKWGYLDINFNLANSGIFIDSQNDYGVVSWGQTTTANVFWSMEGDYKPIIAVFYADKTNQTFTTDDIVIHVYPEQQLSEIESERISLDTNQASLQLSWIILILSAFTVIALIVQIWDVSDNECNYNKDHLDNRE
jgi:hypothetical protein